MGNRTGDIEEQQHSFNQRTTRINGECRRMEATAPHVQRRESEIEAGYGCNETGRERIDRTKFNGKQ